MSSQPNTQLFKINFFPDYFEYTLGDKYLEIYHWNLFQGSRKRTVRLDEIGHRYEVHHNSQFRANFFGLFSMVTMLMTIPYVLFLSFNFFFLFVLAILFFIFFLFSKTRVVILAARPEALPFPSSKQTLILTEKFVQDIIAQSKNYLIWKYGHVDKDLAPEKQFQNYKWLRDIEVIDDEKYEALKQKLKDASEQKEDKKDA